MSKRILLLHGALGSSVELKKLAKLLSSEFEVDVYDFLGHGKRPAHPGITIPELAMDLLTYLKENPAQYVFGYSMGGYVALFMQAHHYWKFDSIFTLGTKLDWGPDTVKLMTGMLDSKNIEKNVPKYASFLKNIHGDKWKLLMSDTIGLMENLSTQSGLSTEDFKSIKCPVTILRGEDDKVVGQSECEDFACLNPNFKLHKIPKSPHELNKVNVNALVSYLT